MQKKSDRQILSARAMTVVQALMASAVSVAGSVDAWIQQRDWYGEDQIMETTGLSRSTVRRALQDLSPYVVCRAKGTGRRGRPPLVYSLTAAGWKAVRDIDAGGLP